MSCGVCSAIAYLSCVARGIVTYAHAVKRGRTTQKLGFYLPRWIFPKGQVISMGKMKIPRKS